MVFQRYLNRICDEHFFYHQASASQSSFSKEEKKYCNWALTRGESVLYNVLYKLSGIQDFKTTQILSASAIGVFSFSPSGLVNTLLLYSTFTQLLNKNSESAHSEFNRGCHLTTPTRILT